MAILIDQSSRVLVQGITGREGQARTRLMLDYGTRVVGGVTPGKGGATVLGLPVFDSCTQAADALGPVDVSVIFVPAAAVKEAALEAIGIGAGLVVLVADRVPVWDAMEILAAAREREDVSRGVRAARVLGPNTLGIACPGKAVVGMIGGRAESARAWFKPPLPGGTGIGIISRSGGMSSSTAYYCGQAGARISAVVHVGGDAVIGLRIPDVARLFEADPETDAIVVFGEIGGTQEEQLAELVAQGAVTKPVIAHIGGQAAREGTRFSHAGAIIEGGRGTHAGKVEALRRAGCLVVDSFGRLPEAVASVLRARGSRSLMSESERKAVWTTGITRVEPNRIAVRGHDISGLMGRVSFGAAVYLILRGELPTEPVARLMDAILVSSIDHGATPPSTLAARTVASTGAGLGQGVAAGILAINKHHGGAIEDAARLLSSLIARAAGQGTSLDDAAAAEVADVKSTGRRLPGFGHRVHTDDPRTRRLFELARLASLGADADQGDAAPVGERSHVAAALSLERAFARAGRPVPINVDGAIGAILADLGFPPASMNGLFMIARVPGLVAHVIEEQSREKPMRRIDPVNHAYDGPPGPS